MPNKMVSSEANVGSANNKNDDAHKKSNDKSEPYKNNSNLLLT